MMREVTNESKSLVSELESLVAELNAMVNCRAITEAERIDLKNKIVTLFAKG